MRLTATLALALALCAGARAQPLADAPTSVLVKLTPAAAARVIPGDAAPSGLASVDALAARFGATGLRRVFRTDPRHAARHATYGLDRWYRVALPGPGDVPAAVAAFGALDDVEAAEPDLVLRIPGTLVPAPDRPIEDGGRQEGAAAVNDPRYPEQWHYHNTGQLGGTPGMDIDLPEAWSVATGSAEVVVHINDSGIDLDHVDLAAAIWTNAGEIPDNGVDDDGNGYVDDVHGWNYVADTNDPDDDAGHGTHCAGTIGAVTNNGVGVAGIAGGRGSGDGVRLMATKFIVAATGTGSLSDWAAGVAYAADNGAVISSNSVSYWLNPLQFVHDAIDYFSDNAGGPGAPMSGGLLIGSAANTGTDPSVGQGPDFAYDRAMGVAALGHLGFAASYTSYGAYVDVSAPGGDGPAPVLSTVPDDGYGFGSGTSMAAPHVAGVAALLAGHIPDATPAEVRRRLEATASDVHTLNPAYHGWLGRGRINAHLALLDAPAAAALVTPASVAVVHSGPETTAVDVTVTNAAGAGAQDLAFSARLANVHPLFPSDTTALGGGPDAYGYRWQDSDRPGGPASDWLDISAIGAPGPTGDNVGAMVNLPFPFPFYGSDKTVVRVTTNGYLVFSGPSGPTDPYAQNAAIPTRLAPGEFIAPFWDNLHVTATGQTDTYHDVANGRFIVQWTNVSRSTGSGNYTFQAVLYPSGEIAFNYGQMTGVTNSATIGIEDATGTVGLPVAFNAPYVHDGLTTRITRTAPWATLAGVSGALAPGASADIQLTLNTVGLPPGAYSADLVVWTSDPAQPVVTVPVTLGAAVSAEDSADGTALFLAPPAPNPAAGPAAVAYELAAAGDVTLEVLDVLGRRVATLAAGPHPPGRYVARWDAAAHASGVYVVRLTAGDEVRTARATVAR